MLSRDKSSVIHTQLMSEEEILIETPNALSFICNTCRNCCTSIGKE